MQLLLRAFKRETEYGDYAPMEFTVTKADLVRELSLSQGVVEKKTTIPILSNVLIETAGDRVNLTATDLELGIRCSCPARVGKAGAGTIPARRLLDYVRLLPDADLSIKFQENQWASVQCGRSRSRLAGMSKESFPELPQMPEVLARMPAGALSSMIGKTIFAISMEESRFTLNGALLILKSDDVFADPQSAVRQSCEHIGLDARFRPAHLEARLVGGYDRNQPEGVREMLRDYFAPHNAALYEFLKTDLGWK